MKKAWCMEQKAYFFWKANGGFAHDLRSNKPLEGVSIAFLEMLQDFSNYCEIPRDNILPFPPDLFGKREVWTFDQDNCPTHTSNIRKQGLAEHSVSTLQWLKEFTYVRVIENMSGITATVFCTHEKTIYILKTLRLPLKKHGSKYGTIFFSSFKKGLHVAFMRW